MPNPGNVNQVVTLTATVSVQGNSTQGKSLQGNASPVGSGSVTFYDGAKSLGSSQLSATGTADITTSFSTVGVHSITSVYGGDTDYSGSTSAALQETIIAGDFSIAAKPGAVSMYTGEAVSVEVSVTSLRGFNQPLALSCSGLPANATCAFSPASLPQGQGAAKLVIQTAAPHKATTASGSGPAAVMGALTLLLLPAWRRRRGLLAGLSSLLLVIAFGIGISGCGSVKPITGGTPPGTYQVAVTAKATGDSTALTHSAIVTLTVKSLF
jgi:MYXO-CTERM domain-containing protein